MKLSKFRRKCFTAVLILNAFFALVLFISSYHTTNRIRKLKESLRLRKSQNKTNSSKSHRSQLLSKEGDTSVILFWTKYFTEDPLQMVSDLEVRMKKSCPECLKKCRTITDRSYLSLSDAVIFHSRDMSRDDWPTAHSNGQMWIYLQQESPSYTNEDLTEYANVFNWTMTYRQDSDIYLPYAHIKRKDKSEMNTSLDLHDIKKKTKLVLWIVSNCNTKGKREDLVDQLEQLIEIDIYGKCGDYSCSHTPPGCLPQISSQYKFYLSFENSVCSDYITEKFFIALEYNLVPVVYGGADYTSLAPPGSFINANDFESPKALANYLLFLNSNPDKYLEYFKWKSEYKIEESNGWCELCRKVQQQKRNPKQKIYGNLWKWWHYTKSSEIPNIFLNEGITPPINPIKEENTFFFPESNYIPACQEEDVLSPFQTLHFVKNIFKLKKLRRWFRNSVFNYSNL